MRTYTRKDITTAYNQGREEERKQAGSLSELLASPCWQPIETAPKDGTEILMYLPGVNNVVSGNWGVNGGWIDCWCSNIDYYTPTRWMPIQPQ